jgi:hypothetical protein
MGLLHLVSSFASKTRGKPAAPATDEIFETRTSGGMSLAVGDSASGILAKLDAIANLLIVSTPAAIREAVLMLDEIQAAPGFLAAVSQHGGSDHVSRMARELKRVHSLAEGALKVQWGRMRPAKAMTQSYAPGGRVVPGQPRWPKLDIRI